MAQAVQQQVTDLAPFASMAQLVAYSHNSIDPSDPTAEVMLEATSNMIRRYCGWHIYPSVEFDLTMDAPGGRVLQLPSRYVTDVASISAAGTLTDPGVYRWSQLGEVERVTTWWGPTAFWPTGFRLLQVAFTSGYEDPPAELTALVLSVVSRALVNPSGVTREQAGGVLVQYSQTAPSASGGLTLMANELQQLEPYRIVGA